MAWSNIASLLDRSVVYEAGKVLHGQVLKTSGLIAVRGGNNEKS